MSTRTGSGPPGTTGRPPAVAVCREDELVPGEPRAVDTGDGPVLVVRTATGLHAVTDRCTHADVALSDGYVEGDTVECPAHFAQFCLRTGVALGMPATEPVPVWQVVVDGGVVHVRRPS